ncbi:beta strand repeat-containing protein, partial [Chryseobacterium hispalense]|uniref:beta strand repeat-containing protein n=1 Tax=Chryseobacterium hispalense TaxID=1453492 RepID=UPI00391A956E
MKKILLFIYGLFSILWTQAQSPGGVSTNLVGWYSADVSASATTWTDRSPAGNNLTGAGTPTFTNLLNFNRVATFNGSNQRFSIATTSASWPGTNTANTYYYVATPTGTNTSRSVFGKGTGANATNGMHSGKGSTATTLVSGATGGGTVSKTSVWAQNTSNIIRTGFNGGATGAHYISDNSAAETSAGSSNPNYASSSAFAIGSENTATGYWDGNIAEVIAYSGKHTSTDFNRVESYLAVKYGITKANNYVNSAGTTIWTSGGGYDNNIAGIGRDDMGGAANSGLNQKQSQSQNSGLQPVIGNVNITDTNANNTNNFGTDLSALVWGSDTGSTGFSTSFAFGGLTSRMTRIWRVQETGTLGTVKVAIPVSQITGSFTQLNLVVSADATFDGSDTRTAMTLETLGGVQYYTATVDFTSGQFFSFAAFVAAPGGVVNGLTLWMNPDLGIDNTANISTWTDQVNGVVIPRKNTSTTLSINTALNFNRVVNMPTTNFNGFELPASNSNISRYDPSAVDGMSVFGAGVQSASWNNYGALISKTDGGAWDSGWVMSTTNIAASNWGLLYVWGNESGSGVGNSAVTPSGSLIRGNAFVASGWWDPALTNKNNIDLDAAFSGSINVTATTSVGSPLGIGYAQGDAFGGQLGDQIYYNRSLSSTERARVQSYLSVKFGTTLGTNALPFNYLNSLGNTIWTGSGTYQNNIAGIARDDASGLNQKQSQSSLSGLQPVIGNVNIFDTNANNTNTFSTDLSALVWGSDTGSTSFATSFAFGGLNNRVTRIWRVQETGTVGTVKVALPASQILGNINNINLIVSSDATFDGTDTRTAMTLETLGGVQYYTATVDFASGQFFTFAALVTSPGGVFANLRIWLKADDGFTPSSWADRSGNSNDFTQTNASRQPNLIAASTKYNFNPTVNFGTTGSDARFMVVPSGRPFTANGLDGTFLLTINQNSNSGFRDYLGFGSTTTGSGLTNANDPVFTSNDNGNRTFRIYPYSGPSSATNLQLTAGTTYISDVTWRVGVAGGITYGLNGFNGTNGNTFTAGNSLGFNGGILGAQPEVSDAFMSEVIAYERALNTTEMQRVRSYLSIKYGMTLDQSTAQNYLASDGTTIFWDATTNAVYKNNIAGIARDDTSALNQKQSQSIGKGTQVVIGNGSIAASNAVNTSNFAADKSALVWGDNGLPLTYITSISNNIPSGLNFAYRMNRIWRVQETGTVGTVKVAMRAAVVAYGENAYIIVSSDPTFATGNTWYPLTTTTTINGVTHYTADIDFTSGQYFTFAAKVVGPGGVPGSSLWLRADKAGTYTNNAAVNNWDDVSVNDNDVLQNTVANQPLYKDNATDNLNFNPIIDFDGSNDILTDADGIIGTSTYTNASAFTVNITKAVSTSNVFQENLGTGNQIALYTPFSDNVAYWDGANNSRIFTAWGGTVNTPYLWTGWNNNSLTPRTSLRRNGLQITSGSTLSSYTGNNSAMNIGSTYNGKIGELVFNPNALSLNERQRVESYLAIKYGFTLDQSTAQNYLNSASTVIWNATTNTGYNNNIAGVMRDDASGLNQKQSASQNTGLQPVIGNLNISDTNINNTNNFGTDLSALVWGSDTGSTSFATSFVFGGLTTRMNRIWKVQETGTVGGVKIAIPASQIPGSITQLNLVVSADATFDGSDSRTAMTLETLGGVQYYTATIDFTTGQFFSFAAFLAAPGGVLGSTSWFKSDADVTLNGSTVSAWRNQSANTNLTQLSQATATRQPAYSTTGWNFNPSIAYDGNSDILENTFPSLLNVLNATNNEAFGALSITGGSGARVYFQISDNGNTSPRLSLENTIVHFPSTSGFITNTGLSQTSSLPSIINFSSGSGNLSYAINGNTPATGTFSGSITAGSVPRYMLGGYNSSGGYSNFTSGNINEIATYDRTLTTTERQRVQSYLALKYGQTLAHTYLNSSGAAIWDIATNTGYNNNITGIARDDASALNQKQSQSVNTGTQVVIGNGSIAATNAANTNNFSADLSALVWGDNGLSLTYTTSVTNNIPSGLNFAYRMSRIWRVQETGTVGTTKVAMRSAAVANGENAYIIVSSSPTFASGNTWYPLTATTTINGVTHYTADIDFTNGQYFTFAVKMIGPGGVVGASLWVRADRAGTYTNNGTVNNWDDVSVNDNDVLQSTTTNQPLYKDNATDNMNFNPVLSFDGTNDYLDATTFTISGSANTLFSAVKPNVVNVTQDVLGFGTVNSSSGGEFRLNNAALEYGQNNGSFVSIASGSVLTAGTPLLFGSSMSNVANGANLYYNNRTITTGTIGQIPSAANLVSIGSRTITSGRNFYFNGLIPEVAAFNSVLTATERQRVNSYLAIKYGMTLDQTTATNYLASDASIFWNATTNTGYNNNIAGIARDDASGLTQKQSQSVNSGLQPVIGNVNISDTNANNTNNFSTDLSALVWGSDTGSTSFGTSFVFGGLTTRITRIWRVQETGTIGTVKLALPVNQLSGIITQLNLVVSSDATFDGSDPRTAMTLETLGGVQYYTATVDFTSGQFFSFAAVVAAPGGVSNGLKLWVKADSGITLNGSTVSSWDNLVVPGTPIAQPTAARQPSYGNSIANNFNPYVEFLGSQSLYNGFLNPNVIPSQTDPLSAIYVYSPNNNSGTHTITEFHPTNNGSGDEPTFEIDNGRGNFTTNSGYTTTSSVVSPINFNTIHAAYWENSTAGSGLINIYNDNVITATRTGSNRKLIGQEVVFGANNQAAGGQTANGRLSEYILYNTNSTADFNRIHSYLAIKYGRTLGTTVSPFSYLNSSSNVIWTADATYQNNIAGISRDDTSALHQKISKSVNSGSVLTISTDTDFTSANSTHAAIGTDLQSLVIGETIGAYTFTGTAVTASGITFGTTEAMARRWKVQDTGG